MQFYSIIVIAFGCALSVLINDGQQATFGYGFALLLKSFWTLIQMTVNIQNLTYQAIEVDKFPQNVKWLADLLTTSFYMVVVIVMLNLLIALMSHTYDKYSQLSEATMLIAKYDVMDSYEMTMNPEEIADNRKKYAVIKEKLSEEYNRDNWYARVSKSVVNYRYGLNLETQNFKWFDDKVASTPPIHCNIVLFIIHPQVDFYNDATTDLSDLSKKIAATIDDFGHYIQKIIVSLESRHPKHISHSCSWHPGASSVDEDGQHRNCVFPTSDTVITRKAINAMKDDYGHCTHDNHLLLESQHRHDNHHHVYPTPGTEITHADVQSGRWIYLDGGKKSTEWACNYTQKLESEKKRKLIVRRDHCLIGSHGHNVIPVINKALQNWAIRSKIPVMYHLKGWEILLYILALSYDWIQCHLLLLLSHPHSHYYHYNNNNNNRNKHTYGDVQCIQCRNGGSR